MFNDTVNQDMHTHDVDSVLTICFTLSACASPVVTTIKWDRIKDEEGGKKGGWGCCFKTKVT